MVHFTDYMVRKTDYTWSVKLHVVRKTDCLVRKTDYMVRETDYLVRRTDYVVLKMDYTWSVKRITRGP